MLYYIVSNMNSKQRDAGKKLIKSQEELQKIGDEMRDIKKEINLLRIEFMVIKSDLLKDKEFEKIKSSEATTETQEEVNKDIIAKGYWWS